MNDLKYGTYRCINKLNPGTKFVCSNSICLITKNCQIPICGLHIEFGKSFHFLIRFLIFGQRIINCFLSHLLLWTGKWIGRIGIPFRLIDSSQSRISRRVCILMSGLLMNQLVLQSFFKDHWTMARLLMQVIAIFFAGEIRSPSRMTSLAFRDVYSYPRALSKCGFLEYPSGLRGRQSFQPRLLHCAMPERFLTTRRFGLPFRPLCPLDELRSGHTDSAYPQ